MTDTEIRIAIAEVCGWEWRPDPHIQHPAKLRWWIAPHMKDLPGCGVGTSEGECPDYLNDLNAMHEAERVLVPAERIVYQSKLICVGVPDPDCANWDIIHSTARQRAEAFLRTLGKWKD